MLIMGERTSHEILLMLQIPEGLWPVILQRLKVIFQGQGALIEMQPFTLCNLVLLPIYYTTVVYQNMCGITCFDCFSSF